MTAMESFDGNQFLASLEPLYHQSKWQQIIDQLEQHQDQLAGWLYHYNLGTVYSKMEAYGAGRYHLEKALSLGAPRTDALNNLEYVLANVPIQDFGRSHEVMDQVFSVWLQWPSVSFLALGLVIFFVFTLILWRKRLRPGLGTLAVGLACLLPVTLDQLVVRKYQVAIVLQEVPVLEGPSGIFEEKYEIPEATKVMVRPATKTEGWYQIIRPQRLSGWIAQDKLGFL